MYRLEYEWRDMGVNSFYYIKKEALRETEQEIQTDFMHCRDISYLSQVMPLIEEFTKEGDLILEPFCGMGTTVIGAGLLGRGSIGIELEEQRYALLKEHMKRYERELRCMPKVICGDSLEVELPKQVDAVVTNVPYYGVGSRHSANDSNFYNAADYTDYLSLIEKVLQRCSRHLKRDGWIILFCENIRALNGDMIPQAYDICKMMQKYFHIKDERIVLYEKDAFAEADAGRTNRAHEYVFIGKKRDEERDLTALLDIAKQLCAQTKCTLIGSLGLYLAYPQVMDTFPQDADFYADAAADNLSNIISLLQQNGYQVYSWQDRIDDAFDYSLLKGRYYFRGVKGGDIVDITYEIQGMEYSEMQPYEIVQDGIKVYNKAGLMKVLDKSDRERNRAQKYRLSLLRE